MFNGGDGDNELYKQELLAQRFVLKVIADFAVDDKADKMEDTSEETYFDPVLI